jgi:hypothetical protein
MIKEVVKCTDYDGNPISQTCYFHLTKFEWLELEAYTKGGLIENLEHALESNNMKKVIDLLKKILLRAYGEKNPETGIFEKDDDRAVRFSKTDAFSVLFYDLAYNEEKSRNFFLGLIPPEVREKALAKLEERSKVVDLPTEQIQE